MSRRFPILIGLLLLIFAIWVQISSIGTLQHYIYRLESLAYDIQLRTKLLTHPVPFKTSVAIIDIDDKSLSQEGRWPWSRAKLANLVTQAQQAGAVIIAFDMIFPEKESNIVETILDALTQNKLNIPTIEDALNKVKPLFDADERFAQALRASDTEMGMSFSAHQQAVNTLRPPLITLTQSQEKMLGFIVATGYISNIPVIQNAVKTTGFVNVFADEDGVIRSVPLLIRYKDNLYPSLALDAVRLFLLTQVNLDTKPYGSKLRLEGITVGEHSIPTDSQARVIIPFRGKSFTFPYYSATDVLRNKIPADALAGKIVFIGTSATGLGDLPPTSVESSFPGVEIQATIADGILSDNFSYKPAWAQGAEVLLTILLGLFVIFIFPHLGAWLLFIMIILIPMVLIFISNWLWENSGLIISVFIPLLFSLILAIINMVYGYLFETRRREQLKEMFGQYVPEKHIDEMLSKSASTYALYGEDREMTVLFADIQNFTGISERFSATQIKELLNDFFTPMTEIIFKHTGTIDKYVGDLIMAFWGAPLQDKQHAFNALSAALDMQTKLIELHSTLVSHGWPEIHVGIGLNSGPMSVGDMGSKFRRNYTVLGDAVNLASRVESLTRYYDLKILVTEFTKQDQNDFIFREVDRVRVKGKEKAVTIYELICRASEVTEEIKKEISVHEIALHYYYTQEWSKAKTLFAELAELHPTVKLYHLYLDRITQFEHNPPSADWDGVFTLSEK